MECVTAQSLYGETEAMSRRANAKPRASVRRAAHSPVSAHVGSSTPRREDQRLLRGEGSFIGNVNAVNQLWMRVVRSTVAHGTIAAIHTREAQRMPGVALVLVGTDTECLGGVPIRDMGYHELFPDLDQYAHPILAVEHVRTRGAASRSCVCGGSVCC